MFKGITSKLAQYPRLRVLLIIVLIVIVFVVLLNVMSGGEKKRSDLPPSRAENVNPQGKAQVTQEQEKQYKTLNERVDKQQFQQRVSTGQTVLDNAFDSNNVKETNTFAQTVSNKQSNAHLQNTHKVLSPDQFAHEQQQSGSLKSKLDALNPVNQADAVFGQKRQSAASAEQQAQAQQQQQQQMQAQQQLQELANNYRSAISSASGSWNLPKMTAPQEALPSAKAAATNQAPPPKTVIKAGTIYFGVMETALDSDQSGTPVLAQIVSGPFTGAKLMGTFQRQKYRLVIQFSRMSMPQWSDTIGISAYAIDAKTANNALATSVNHHYLLRYGMLFASAFLEGFGNAYQSFTYACPPGTASCNIVNSDGLQNNRVTATTAAYQGLGQVGSNLGQAASQVFNTPPTVKVAQGTGIGVLFMSDVTLSTEQ